ncbi:hypothetical protein LTR37_014043 [Vermiconidia calcicola]|uniref:Uncharacterized protein n=1 Tax=Vermiconidia calcicola TaxID=1690605 RepID=A0ACC3MUJ9_9PEZI|nr:hypothetical protein LTR37_014043 [Vermiconidia calcicola]
MYTTATIQRIPAIIVTRPDDTDCAELNPQRQRELPSRPVHIPGSGLARRILCKPRMRARFLSVPENREIQLQTRCERPQDRRPAAKAPPMPKADVVPLELRHMSTARLEDWSPDVLAESTKSVTIPYSMSFADLYSELQGYAAKVAFATSDVSPSDVNGTIFITVWGGTHCVTKLNWMRDTQHMCGIEGAQLRFDFHVLQQELYCGQPRQIRDLSGKEVHRQDRKGGPFGKLKKKWAGKVESFEANSLEKLESFVLCGRMDEDADGVDAARRPGGRHDVLMDDMVRPHASINDGIWW